jgi:hypothetical protein
MHAFPATILVTYCHSIASPVLSNPPGREFKSACICGSASMAEPVEASANLLGQQLRVCRGGNKQTFDDVKHSNASDSIL